eukprot:TRINITY_DN3231_c0_g1_i1.p1 TRINITY_DN3231_c0_g1~~TRINITY_DN3231_c0_g1_i1.p1  ORF type:complete len:324 (+),score=92.95 TRINITY_DN3231_c0_g1_i1:96-1067(+)
MSNNSNSNDNIEFEINPDDLELMREIGRGGTATVYEAVHKPSGVHYAVKSINKLRLGKIEWNNLQREVDIMRNLSHPNVLKMHSIFQTPDQYHLILDYMSQGELLNQIFNQGKFTESDAQSIVKQILEGVAYLHENGICHRDLKLENLLCSEKGDVVISDFGLSKFFGRGQLLKTRCGTVGYCAPEVVVGDIYTDAVDIWAIGVITYILLSGEPPFYGSDQQVFDQILELEIPFPDKSFEHISTDAKEFICSLLTTAEERPTARQCLELSWLQSDIIEDDNSFSIYLNGSLDAFLSKYSDNNSEEEGEIFENIDYLPDDLPDF